MDSNNSSNSEKELVMVRKTLVYFLVVCASALFFVVPSFSLGNSDAGKSASVTAPDFSLNDLTGKQVNLRDFKGNKAVLLVFWATWCPYCVQEIPELKKINAEYKDKGLEIIAVDIKENPVAVTNFAKKQAIDYAVVIDVDGSVSKSYNVLGIPTNVVIDKNGFIQHNENAMPSRDLLDKVVGEIKVK